MKKYTGKKKRKYDIIIYSSLILAFLCVVISAIDYSHSLSEDQTVTQEVKEALIEIKEPIQEEVEEIEVEQEPDTMQNIDKISIVQKYLDEIYDSIIKDDIVSYSMIHSWKKYEVTDITYNRQILDYYYSYQINIKIYGSNPNLPTAKREDLSTDNYTVITLNANILSSTAKNGYIVKTLEIPIQD